MPDYRRNRVPGGTYFFPSICSTAVAVCWSNTSTPSAKPCGRCAPADPFISMHGSSCRTIPIASGRFRPATLIIPGAGKQSRSHLRSPCRKPSACQRYAHAKANAASGSGDSGNIRPAMSAITRRTSINYVHINPYKHGLARQVSDWPYSSFHRFVVAGIYPGEWAGEMLDLVAGERSV